VIETHHPKTMRPRWQLPAIRLFAELF